MRTLFLMRHASTEGHNHRGDKARELTDEGIAEAREVGAELRGRGVHLVLCSTAVRTQQTLAHLELDARVELMDAIYSGGTDTLRQRISEVEDEVETLLVIGHAPTIPSLASQLSYQSDPGEADRMGCWFPTATLVEFQVDASWADLADPDAPAALTRVTRR